MTTAQPPAGLDYTTNGADNHFNEPPDCFERYIDPEARENILPGMLPNKLNPLKDLSDEERRAFVAEFLAPCLS